MTIWPISRHQPLGGRTPAHMRKCVFSRMIARHCVSSPLVNFHFVFFLPQNPFPCFDPLILPPCGPPFPTLPSHVCCPNSPTFYIILLGSFPPPLYSWNRFWFLHAFLLMVGIHLSLQRLPLAVPTRHVHGAISLRTFLQPTFLFEDDLVGVPILCLQKVSRFCYFPANPPLGTFVPFLYGAVIFCFPRSAAGETIEGNYERLASSGLENNIKPEVCAP